MQLISGKILGYSCVFGWYQKQSSGKIKSA